MNSPLVRALIKNFDPKADLVQLFGDRSDFSFGLGIYHNDFRISNFPVAQSFNQHYGTIEGGASFSNVLLANQGRNNFIFSGDKPLISNFLESDYLANNPDVAAAVKAGNFTSGLDHYTKFGQFEPNRVGVFAGTSGNDVVKAFGSHTLITGVALDRLNISSRRVPNPLLSSNGSNEFDTLIGGEGADTFVLGIVDAYNQTATSFYPPSTESFYGGSGLVRIQGFNQSQGDELQLVGGENGINDYQISPEGADLVISQGTHKIAILEGGANLTLKQLTPSPVIGSYTFLVG